MIQLVAIPPAKVAPIWPRLDAFYEHECSLTKGAFTKDIIRTRAIAGNCDIWIAADETTEIKASCVTSIIDFPGGLRALFVEMLAGPQKYLVLDFAPTLEKRAAKAGCTAVYMLAGKHARGKAPGYKNTHILIFKDIG